MRAILALILAPALALGLQVAPLAAQEAAKDIQAEIDTAVQMEKRRLTKMYTLAPLPVADLQSLTIGDVQELKCHTTSNGKWIRCDWPYSPNLCSNIGWIPHTDGSCCLRID
ncbi:MAG: hypothetical protein EP318_04675 [Rhodobacteraceae bacterium]|nr:MAG: hypothetical protein EP318_04675 [Paracoccaceae bacterium]